MLQAMRILLFISRKLSIVQEKNQKRNTYVNWKFDKSQIHHFVVQTFGCGSKGTFTKSPSNFHEILSLIENSLKIQ